KTMKLAYWDIRGLAQPIRLLLEYTGTCYEEKFYTCGEVNAEFLNLDYWFTQLPTMTRLPYLEDGDRKITQSNAIMRYIARKHNLCGETEDEKVRVDIIENQAMDFRNGFVMLCYMDFITFVDFIMYELLDQHRMFRPCCLNNFKNLKDFLDRFEGLDKIKAYMKSNRFIKTPVNNKMAKWGNKKE
uniref:glutathione transferase n=1 Tax=Periophthalmus magnuspinnatus TaxID=409849 RepID=A0A3B4A9N3_9GOBI